MLSISRWRSPIRQSEYDSGPLIDDATLHHEGHTLGHANVFERIAGYGDHVGVISSVKLTDLSLPAEQLRAVEQVGLQHLDSRHAEFVHQHKFPGLGAMGERSDIRADRKGNPDGHLLLKLCRVIVEHRAL